MPTSLQQPEHGERFIKFSWLDLDQLPPIGQPDYLPKGGRLFRLYRSGEFQGEHLEVFPRIKLERKLESMGHCIYCQTRSKPLTSEHIIPEFLGAGLELPSSSCPDCQAVTAAFEGSLATEMFDPVRKELLLIGKKGTLKKSHFPVDIGCEETQYEYMKNIYYPTILTLPALYPAASYSNRHVFSKNIFNLRIYNINAHKENIYKYNLENISSPHIDLLYFSQMLAKIAHSYAIHYFRKENIVPLLDRFIRTRYNKSDTCEDYFKNIGCILGEKEESTESLHEIEAGIITWMNKKYYSVRIRLFSCYGMPSYYVTVGDATN